MCVDDNHDWELLFDSSDETFILYCKKCGAGPTEPMKGAYIDGLFI